MIMCDNRNQIPKQPRRQRSLTTDQQHVVNNPQLCHDEQQLPTRGSAGSTNANTNTNTNTTNSNCQRRRPKSDSHVEAIPTIPSLPTIPTIPATVTFGMIEVIELPFSLGDSPAVSSGGPPLSIGWHPIRRTQVAVTVFEQFRRRKRRRDTRRDLLITKQQREGILLRSGYTRDELNEATLEVKRLRRLRLLSQIDQRDNFHRTSDDTALDHVSIHTRSRYNTSRDEAEDRRNTSSPVSSSSASSSLFRDGRNLSLSSERQQSYHLVNRFDRIRLSSDSGLLVKPKRIRSPASPRVRKAPLCRTRSNDELISPPTRRDSPPPLELRRQFMEAKQRSAPGRILSADTANNMSDASASTTTSSHDHDDDDGSEHSEELCLGDDDDDDDFAHETTNIPVITASPPPQPQLQIMKPPMSFRPNRTRIPEALKNLQRFAVPRGRDVRPPQPPSHSPPPPPPQCTYSSPEADTIKSMNEPSTASNQMLLGRKHVSPVQSTGRAVFMLP